jgi:DNA polymerase alpha subunit A
MVRMILHMSQVSSMLMGRAGDINAIVDTNIIFLTEMSAAVSKYVDQSGRRWVELGSLFSFMKI